MTVLLIALGVFGLSWLVHLAWWRCALPARQTRALITVFAGGPGVAVLALALLDQLPALSPPSWAALALFHGGATLCYLITYAGIEETSPSLVIIRTLEEAGERGATREELHARLAAARFLPPRIDALVRDGLITRADGMLRLTPRGERAAILARRISTLFNLGSGA